MAEIDDLLSVSLKRLAQPGDATGVADAIRSRVVAGDAGAPASSSGFTSGVGSWLPWIGLIVVAGLVGGSAGAAGLAGHPQVEQVLTGTSGAIAQHATAALCVEGPVVANLPAGERVLATERSDDSGWLGVRNPVTLAGTIWVPASAVTVDDGQPELASLPVGGGCPVVTVVVDPPVVVAPAPVVPPTNGGGGGSAPAPGDGQAPSISSASASPTTVYNNGVSTVTASASDNVGVASVSISWSGAVSGSASMSPSGGVWQYAFSSNDTAGGSYGTVTFQITAYDAAGNPSASAFVNISRQYFG